MEKRKTKLTEESSTWHTDQKQTCKTRCQPHLQEDAHPHPPASGPKAGTRPSGRGAIAKKTQEQFKNRL